MIGIDVVFRGQRSGAATRVLVAILWKRKKEEREEERNRDGERRVP